MYDPNRNLVARRIDISVAKELNKLSPQERQMALEVIRDVEANNALSSITDELNSLPAHEREKVLFDLHGICDDDVENSLEQIASSLTEMSTYLTGEQRDQRSEEQRLNSSHTVISYAVFCLKKKNK